MSPSRLEIKEIEMEGWGRLCGHPCLGLNVPAISDYYQVTKRRHGIYIYKSFKRTFGEVSQSRRWPQLGLLLVERAY